MITNDDLGKMYETFLDILEIFHSYEEGPKKKKHFRISYLKNRIETSNSGVEFLTRFSA